MRCKLVALLAVVTVPALVQSAPVHDAGARSAGTEARGDVHADATAVVETEDAVWFSTRAEPDAVYYFGKTYTAFEELSPASGRRRFRVQERLRQVTPPADLGSLHAAWSGRRAQPIALTPDTSCRFEPTPEMLQVAQQADMKGRSFQGNTTAPLCQFSFHLARDIGDDYVAELAARAEQGTLLVASLWLTMTVPGTLSWADLHRAIVAGDAGDTSLSRQDTAVVIGWALTVTPTGVEGYERLDAAQRDAFTEAARAALFTREGDMYRLAPVAPQGELTGWVDVLTVEL